MCGENLDNVRKKTYNEIKNFVDTLAYTKTHSRLPFWIELFPIWRRKIKHRGNHPVEVYGNFDDFTVQIFGKDKIYVGDMDLDTSSLRESMTIISYYFQPTLECPIVS